VIAEIVAAYEAGTPSTLLVKQHALSKGAGLRCCVSGEWSYGTNPSAKDEVRQVVSRYESDSSMARSGQKLGRQHTAVRDVLVRAGVKRRDSHGRG